MKPRTRKFDAEAFIRRWRALNDLLVQHGFHKLSAWWAGEVERFVRALATGRRRWIIRAGRRGGKSSTLARLAVCWALWGEWRVPTGDAGVVAFVSTAKDEAASRLRTIAKILEVLGVENRQVDQQIEAHVEGRGAVIWKVFPATISGVVGPTLIAFFGDEVAHWESRDSRANPAAEVIGASLPALATQPFGFAVMSSAPWGDDDYHAQRFDDGETAHQIVSFAATWHANPSITEEETHALEPDPKRWAQAYAAQPQGTLTKALDGEDLAACYSVIPSGTACGAFLSTDASSLRNDGFAWVQGYRTTAGYYVVTETGAWEGAELRSATLETITASLANRAKRINAPEVLGDQREAAGLTTLFAQHGVRFRFYSWTEETKDRSVQWLRRVMRERRLVLCPHDGLRNELRDLKARVMPSGRISYETNGLDYASALITLAHSESEGGANVYQSVDWSYLDQCAALIPAPFGGFGSGGVIW